MIDIPSELEEINREYPTHSKTSCSDQHLVNTSVNGVCYRCSALALLDREVLIEALTTISSHQFNLSSELRDQFTYNVTETALRSLLRRGTNGPTD